MKIAIIVGSVRPNSVSTRVAKWVESEAKAYGDVEVLDLHEYPLPFFDEEGSPQYTPDRQPAAAVRSWLDKLAAADAYVLVTPEYNRSTSGVLKNALDHVDYQMQGKPVALVGHGSTGGAQAVANLRMAVPGLLAVTVPKATYLAMPAMVIDENGTLDEEAATNPYGPLASLMATLEELQWYGEALAEARSTTDS